MGVRVLARPGFQPRVFADLDLQIEPGDVCNADDVRRAVRGAVGVVHSAGYVQMGWSRPEAYRAVNVEGSRNVAVATREAGVRMVHVSSCDALGVRSLADPADEDTPFAGAAPVPYAVTKAQAEGVVLEEVARGLDAVIVNPAFMLGPWDWKPSSGRMLLAVARGQGWFAPPGHFNVCDVRDVAAGILAALDRGQSGRRYILGGETMSYLDAWRLFADVVGVRRPIGRIGPVITRLAGWGGDVWGRLSGTEPDVNSAARAGAGATPKTLHERPCAARVGLRATAIQPGRAGRVGVVCRERLRERQFDVTRLRNGTELTVPYRANLPIRLPRVLRLVYSLYLPSNSLPA